VGVDIVGDLEPSDVLVDKFTNMQEVTGVLRYISFAELGRRDEEMRGVKKDVFWKPDASGNLRQHDVGKDVVADLSTDYKMCKALMRRGVAMDMARLLSFQNHELLVRWYMRELHRDALPGYKKTSLDQIALVDKEIFMRLTEETRSGLHIEPLDGGYVLDRLLPSVMLEPRIISILNPLPAGGNGSGGPPSVKRAADNELDKLRQDNKRLKQTLGKFDAKGHGKGGKDGKDQGKKFKQKGGPRMPKELLGYDPHVDNKPACFSFNLKQGCSRSVDSNGACEKGLHACLKCGSRNHGLAKCTR
jgi:hypothetical protein